MPERRVFRNSTAIQAMEPIEWLDGKIRIIDQSRLPHHEVQVELADYEEVAEAIKMLRIRGAPLIGIAGAYGLALCAQTIEARSQAEFLQKLRPVAEALASTRPTAVNLRWAIDRMVKVAEAGKDVTGTKTALVKEGKAIHDEERKATRKLSHLGAELIKDGFTILTHCNAGSLATGGYGTALGVVKAARQQGKNISVIATETRPLLQGARLTTWELMRAGIPVTLITDSMAGHFLSRQKVNCVITGADRIAANGDAANKIGTYALAVLARENKVPFYVAAPLSTIDCSIPSGDGIPIEERSPDEVTHVQGIAVAAPGVHVANPAFDVTPHRYISAIITERGIVRTPFRANIAALFKPELGKSKGGSSGRS
jgi:methylthioribose-1-phosphate isomerase